MDTQQKFEKFLKEDRTAINVKPYQPGDPQFGSVDDVTFNAANVQDPVILQRINGYLNSVASTPTINPYFVGKRIQDKLGIIGLHFDIPYFIGDRGSEKKPVSQFGGMYGYENPLGKPYPHETGDTKSVGFPDIGSNDGIKNRIPGGLDIKFTWTSIKGIYTLDVQLVPGSALKSNLKEDENLDEGIGHMIPHDNSPEAEADFNKSVEHATKHGYQPISHGDTGVSMRHPGGHELMVNKASVLLKGKSSWSHKPKGQSYWGGKYGNASLKQHLRKFHGN